MGYKTWFVLERPKIERIRLVTRDIGEFGLDKGFFRRVGGYTRDLLNKLEELGIMRVLLLDKGARMFTPSFAGRGLKTGIVNLGLNEFSRDIVEETLKIAERFGFEDRGKPSPAYVLAKEKVSRAAAKAYAERLKEEYPGNLREFSKGFALVDDVLASGFSAETLTRIANIIFGGEDSVPEDSGLDSDRVTHYVFLTGPAEPNTLLRHEKIHYVYPGESKTARTVHRDVETFRNLGLFGSVGGVSDRKDVAAGTIEKDSPERTLFVFFRSLMEKGLRGEDPSDEEMSKLADLLHRVAEYKYGGAEKSLSGKNMLISASGG